MVGQSGIVAGHAYVLIEAVDRTGRVLQQVSQRLNRLGDQVAQLGMRLMALGATLGIPFIRSIRDARDYTDELMHLKAVLGVTDAQLKSTADLIRELGRTTSFTAAQIAATASELGRGGFSQPQIEGALESVLNLARAGRLDLAMAGRIMVQTMSVFSIEANKSSQIADKFFEAARNGVANVTEMAEAFTYVGQSASGLQISLDETLAVLAVMSNSMLTGSIAGTSLNNAFVNVTKNAEKFQEQFGFSPIDRMTGDILPLQTLILGISNAISKMGTGQAKKAIQEALNIRGARAAEAMVRQMQEIPKVLAKIKGSTGEAAEAAKIMDSDIGGSLRILWSAFNDLSIAVGEKLEPIFMTLRERFVPIINGVSEWVQKNGILIRQIALWVTGLVAAGASLMAVGLGLKFVAFALSPFITALKVSRAAIFLVIKPLELFHSYAVKPFLYLIRAGIYPLIKSVILLTYRFVWSTMTMTASMAVFTAKTIGQMILLTARALIMGTVFMVQLPAMFAKAFAAIFNTVLNIVTMVSLKLAQSIAYVAVHVLTMISTVTATIIGVLSSTIVTILGPIALFVAAAAVILPIFFAIRNAFRDAGTAAGEFFGDITNVLDWIYAKIVWLAGTMKKVFSSLWNPLVTFLRPILSTIWESVSIWSEAVIDYFREIPATFMSLFGDIPGWFNKRFSEMWTIVNDVFTAIKNRIMAGDIEGAMEILMAGIKGIWAIGIANIKEAWLQFTSFFKEAWIGAASSIKIVWRNTQNSLSKMILDWAAGNKVANWFMKLVSGVDIQKEIERNAALNSQLGTTGGGLEEAKRGLDEDARKDIEAIERSAAEDRARMEREKAELLAQYDEDRAEALAKMNEAIKKVEDQAKQEEERKKRKKKEQEDIGDKRTRDLALAMGAGMGAGQKASVPGVAMKYTAEAAKQAYENQWRNSTLNALLAIQQNTAAQNEKMRDLVESGIITGVVGAATGLL